MSALTSSMISSMLLVAWILLVTFCSCFWNARRAPTSVWGDACGLRTALIDCLPVPASTRRPSTVFFLGLQCYLRYHDFQRIFPSASVHFLQSFKFFRRLSSRLPAPRL